jgi:hypothetical protein
MSYYLRVVSGPQMHANQLQVRRIEGSVAVCVGIANPELSVGTYFRAEPGETICEAIRRQTPWFEPDGQNPFHKSVFRPGQFYPRMARPSDQHPHQAPGWSPGAQIEKNIVAMSRGQLTVLTRQLDRICQTVHPSKEHANVFGHDIRNLLILACTEVENHWRGVLVANGGVTKDRYSTRDYVALQDATKLNEYAVSFPNYPWFDSHRPYEGWGSSGRPTQDLGWYDAYNAVKHNRETEFARATLHNAFDAISACVIMMAAQFGPATGIRSAVLLLPFHRPYLAAVRGLYLSLRRGGRGLVTSPLRLRQSNGALIERNQATPRGARRAGGVAGQGWTMMKARFRGQTRPHMLSSRLTESDPTGPPVCIAAIEPILSVRGKEQGARSSPVPACISLACAGELDPLAHLSVSSVISLPKSADVIGTGRRNRQAAPSSWEIGSNA